MSASITASRSIRVAPRDTKGRGDLVLIVAAPICAAVVLTGEGPLILRIVAGVVVLILLPVLLVNAKINWPEGTKLHESLLYSLAAVVLALMVGGLVINQALWVVGIARPLDRVPVVSTLLIALAALGLWRRERWRWHDGLSAGNRMATPTSTGGWRDQLVLLCGLVAVVGSVAGPIRLNNGASGAVTTGMLVIAAIVIVMVFSWRQILNESTIAVSIYLLSLSLLLMTSLRGWFVTGHDVQREFRMFEVAAGQGVWSVESVRSAYNACLSITILPTVIERTTGIPDIYIFKVVVQLLYALCPVLIYLIARRFASTSVAFLAAVYFIAFPTYFTDMPFLNRQEVAFFFLGVALLLITNRAVPIRTRRMGFFIFGVGVILSHYSSSYVLLGVLILGRILTRAALIGRKYVAARQGRHRQAAQRPVRVQSPCPRVLTWTVIAALAVVTFVWSYPVTGVGVHVEQTFRSALNSLAGKGEGGLRSSDAAYFIFGGAKPRAEDRLRDYRNTWIETTAQERADGTNYPLSKIDKYPTPVVAAEKLPATALGKVIDGSGISVSTANGLLRGGAPILLQLCVGVGFVLVLLGRASGFKPSPEFLTGAAGSIAMVTLHVLLPNVSVDYGILRTFAQGLFWLAPFLAVGSIQAFSWLGQSASIRVSLGLAIVFFLSLTGVIPQLLGGYPPQLHLNNSGQYYDNCYLHPQEVSAIRFLQSRITADEAPDAQSQAACYLYAFTDLQKYSEPSSADDIFPVIVRRDAYAFLGYTNIRKGEAAFSYAGDLVTYKYPVGFLDKNKDLIYSSDGARIYR
jgi:uncharacterized membrane protein